MTKNATTNVLELGVPELFKSLTEIQLKDNYIDLHNNYNCYYVNYLKSGHELVLAFKTSMEPIQPISHLELHFTDVEIVNMTLAPEDITHVMTIDTLYRGKYEDESVLKEFSIDGKGYYYLEFYIGYSCEFFCKTITILY